MMYTFATTVFRCLCTVARLFAVLLVVYLAVVAVGLIPANDDFKPAGSEGVEILVMSNPVHADIVMPIANDVINWRDHFPTKCFRGDTRTATHVAVGWGDRGFYIETPTWADLRFSTTARAAFLPTETCLHVSMHSRPKPGKDIRSVRISKQQYRQLVDYVLKHLRRSSEGPRQIDGAGYSDRDAFFEARGHYHFLYTCNSWAGDALQAAGVPVGRMTPWPKTVLLHLPE